MSRTVRSLLALVVLTLFLGTGAAHALPTEGRDAGRGPGMLVAVWEWVASLLEGRVPFIQIHEAVGEPALPTPPETPGGDPNRDFGGSIDPNG
ncbi:MAG TPA: hypothetical protein VF179_16735 [Thermoanaerobaculia bacterium]|nr:hypothetical protein [Thermoanaerobaculia bacterium]